MNATETAPVWDRFAHWRPWPARLLLGALAVLLVLAALTPLGDDAESVPPPATALAHEQAADTGRDKDLALYDRIIERIEDGEFYYDFVVEEQRSGNYPVRPGITVRLPTLAYVHAWVGESGMVGLAILLMLACTWAWWKRLTAEPGGPPCRLLGTAFMFMGASLGLNRYFFVLHELWAGMLIALAFGLHRPGRWGWSLAFAALALAIREHALPFVLLLCAMAAWRRDWKEAAAWGTLILAFLAILTLHLSLVAPHVLANDPQSPPWLVLRGLPGWLGNIVLTSNLRLLPHPIAGPLVLLMVLGWAGWKSPAGTTGTLLYLGYGLLFVIAGRANNYYWGAVVAPAMFVGLAFLPMAIKSLVRAARQAT